MELKRWIYKKNINLGESKSFLDSLLDVKNIQITDKADFINPVFDRKKCSLRFKECKEAASLVKKWIKENKKIIIFGDYDVDGICATAILKKTFDYLEYQNTSFHIPNRFDEGYGINPKSIKLLIEKNPDAVISVDCGINANEGVQYLKDKGIDVLITDHHLIPPVLPNADFILDPKLCHQDSQFYELCGAGLALYLALHLLPDTQDYSEILQLAALATIADLVPLNRDNRLIVASGINLMKNKPFYPLYKLFELSSLQLKDVNAGNLAFKIAPIINAAGRLKHAYEALNLLISMDKDYIAQQAKFLFNLNLERKSKQEKVINQAIDLIDSDLALLNNGVLLVYSAEWHEGVIGIAASRLVEYYNRPAIVFALNNGILKGSARSIGDFSIYDAINFGKDYLNTFGGHRVACGLSLNLDKFDDFKRSIKEYCDYSLTDEHLELKQKVDLELRPEDISFKNLDLINSLEPFGIGNAKPIFSIENFNIKSSFLMGKSKNHLKMTVDKDELVFESVKFNLKNPPYLEKDYRVDICFNLKENDYMDKNNLQFMLKNLRLYDPSIKGLPALAFAFYSKSLVDNILKNGGNIKKYSQLVSVEKSNLIKIIEDKKKLVINNYESLLYALYTIYDAGISLKKLSNYLFLKNIIEVFPSNSEQEMFLYGYDSFYVPNNENRQAKFRDFILKQLRCDKVYFKKMLLHLKKVKKINILQFIYSSLFPLRTAVGLAVLKEQGVIVEQGNQFLLQNHNYNNFDFDDSLIKVSIDKFYSIL